MIQLVVNVYFLKNVICELMVKNKAFLENFDSHIMAPAFCLIDLVKINVFPNKGFKFLKI